MSNFQLAGFIVFCVGLVPFTIGGLIFLRSSYDSWNAELLRDPSWSWWDRKIGFGGILSQPKSRWWCGIGFAICLAGFLLLLVSTVSLSGLALYTALFGAFFGLHALMARRRR
ncbi:hypothetical protein NKI19_21710 [Mesorhizobium sp. M0751]|uniref:hypothetical protein n=1 Tax=unclassified Mesorhizobium TaxID=325217 RepID=UPI003335A589